MSTEVFTGGSFLFTQWKVLPPTSHSHHSMWYFRIPSLNYTFWISSLRKIFLCSRSLIAWSSVHPWQYALHIHKKLFRTFGDFLAKTNIMREKNDHNNLCLFFALLWHCPLLLEENIFLEKIWKFWGRLPSDLLSSHPSSGVSGRWDMSKPVSEYFSSGAQPSFLQDKDE